MDGTNMSEVFFNQGTTKTHIIKLFFLNGPIPASFLFIFVLFSLQFQYKLKKA